MRILFRCVLVAVALAASPVFAQAVIPARPPMPPPKPGPADFERATREMNEREKARPQAVKPRTAQDEVVGK